ncbi:MAG: hypothetical protein AB7E70_10255 [Hyphomicrobiaceae bacterium]
MKTLTTCAVGLGLAIVPAIIWAGLAVGSATATAQASGCYAPQGAERKAVLDTLRGPVADILKQPVQFVVRKIRVCWSGNPTWAFVDAKPQQPAGRPINWKAAGFDDCSETNQALLRRTPAGQWTVIANDVCPTDVPWADWNRAHGAPNELFK